MVTKDKIDKDEIIYRSKVQLALFFLFAFGYSIVISAIITQILENLKVSGFMISFCTSYILINYIISYTIRYSIFYKDKIEIIYPASFRKKKKILYTEIKSINYIRSAGSMRIDAFVITLLNRKRYEILEYDKIKAKLLLDELKKMGVEVGVKSINKSDLEIFKDYLQAPVKAKRIISPVDESGRSIRNVFKLKSKSE